MALTKSKLQRHFSAKRIMLPALLGLGVMGFMFYENYDPQQLSKLLHASPIWMSVVVLLLLVRDFGYMYRIRIVTDKYLTWKQSFNVVMLWEFASCALPSVVGGSTVATYILYKEGIPVGKSLSQVMVTAMLDNFYFVLALPLVLLFTNVYMLPEMVGLHESIRFSLGIAFFISYLLIALYAFLMFYALFVNPRAVKKILLRIGQNKLLRKKRQSLCKHANELLVASQHLKHKTLGYWIKVSLSTVFVWTARYAIIGCLVAAFSYLDLFDHLVIFSRNLVYKVVLFVSVTPGAAGFAELSFPAFFGAFLGGSTAIIILVYRLLTYYLYLMIGAFIFPRWANRVFVKEQLLHKDVTALAQEK